MNQLADMIADHSIIMTGKGAKDFSPPLPDRIYVTFSGISCCSASECGSPPSEVNRTFTLTQKSQGIWGVDNDNGLYCYLANWHPDNDHGDLQLWAGPINNNYVRTYFRGDCSNVEDGSGGIKSPVPNDNSAILGCGDQHWDNIERFVTNGVVCGWDGRAVISLPPKHQITASAGPNGSISPSGTISLYEGDSQQFTATPASGYVVDSWTVDGSVVQSGGTTYTLSDITTDHAVYVSFKVAPDTTPPLPNPSQWGVDPYQYLDHDDNMYHHHMEAVITSDAETGGHDPCEYYFQFVSGGYGPHDSGWQLSNVYDYAVSRYPQYGVYRVKARDSVGNETGWSPEASTG
jgi:hypothetical protein